MADGKNRGIKLKTVYAIFAVLAFGTALIALNAYQLYHLSTSHVFETSPRGIPGRPTAWIFSEEVRDESGSTPSILMLFDLGLGCQN